MTRWEELLGFWFGPKPLDAASLQERERFWFGGGSEQDALCRERFGEDFARACRGELDGWAQEGPRARLALVLLLDQFSRNLQRGTPQAFAQDARAVALTREALTRGEHQALSLHERVFLYLPLEHAEDLALQEASVVLYQRLLEEAPLELKESLRGARDYAERHRDIIARFGRFPHRNTTLGRASTPQEEAFLRLPFSRF